MINFGSEQQQYLDQKEAYLDSFIDQDDEYKLFISSYIHGHFSVVAAKLSTAISKEQTTFFDDMNSFVSAFQGLFYNDIENAIANQELNEDDAAAVLKMLNDMFT